MEKRYNYPKFTPEAYSPSSPVLLKPGDIFPNICLETLKGPPLCLSTYQGQWIVLETGSITCPHYIANIRSMNKFMREFPHVKFVVVYVRETHPGENIPAHTEFAQKRRMAHLTHEAEDENRCLIIDTLEGGIHRLLGTYPNAVCIIGPNGKIVFLSMWNKPRMVSHILKQRQLEPTSLFHPHPPLLLNFTTIRVLARAGYKAFWNMAIALPKILLSRFKS